MQQTKHSLPCNRPDPDFHDYRCVDCGWEQSYHDLTAEQLQHLGFAVGYTLCPICGNPLDPTEAQHTVCPPNKTPDNIIIGGGSD